MSTDDQVRATFHATFDPVVVDLVLDPGLLTAVRRRNTRQTRALLIGAPLGVLAIAAGSVIGSDALSTTHDLGMAPIPTANTGPAVTVLGHQLRLPAGWTATTTPAERVKGGEEQSWSAHAADFTQAVIGTVFSGRPAKSVREADLVDGGSFTSIHGLDVMIANDSQLSGTCASIRQHRQAIYPRLIILGGPLCSEQSPPDVDGTSRGPGLVATVPFRDGDGMTLTSSGLTPPQLETILEGALG